jgi:hypothetical protein
MRGKNQGYPTGAIYRKCVWGGGAALVIEPCLMHSKMANRVNNGPGQEVSPSGAMNLVQH